jgi:hypothetical protein
MQRQNFVNLTHPSRLLWFSLLVILFCGQIEPKAAVQTISFGPKTDFATGVEPLSVEAGDFNSDGKQDLAVANTVSNSVSILLGTGTGIFGPKTDYGAGSFPYLLAVGDFNGDGKLDLATANRNNDTVSILLSRWKKVL